MLTLNLPDLNKKGFFLIKDTDYDRNESSIEDIFLVSVKAVVARLINNKVKIQIKKSQNLMYYNL